jgi:hypothetical protein
LSETLMVFVGNFQKTEAYGKGFVVVHIASVRPDHLARECYDGLVEWFDGYAQNLVERKRLIAIDRHAVIGNIHRFSFNLIVISKNFNRPSHIYSRGLSLFDEIIQVDISCLNSFNKSFI